MRYAYNRLLEGKNRKDLKKELQSIFKINSRYVDDAIMKAQSVINSCKEKNQNPVKVIFGGRELFVKLKRSHLTGEKRKKLKKRVEGKKDCSFTQGRQIQWQSELKANKEKDGGI